MVRPLRFTAFQSLAAVSLLLSAALPAAVVQAQTVPQDIANAAEAACKQSAEAKGFQVVDVVSIEPKSSDGANVVLNLTKEGQAYKLTCGYSKSAGAVFGTDAAGVTTASAPADLSRLWWLLLPLLGLPALLAWVRGRGEDVVTSEWVGHEGIIRRASGSINVYSGPDDTYNVVGTLRDGQRVALSGRYENNWVELKDGGWIPSQFVETGARYATP